MMQIKSLKHASDILNLYSSASSVLGVSEVALKLGVNKSTSARLMATLEAGNILKRNPGSRKYGLGRKVVELAKIYISSLDLKTVASPYLKELNAQTNEGIRLHVLEGNRRLCIAWVDSRKPVRHFLSAESVYGPLHAGAPGKLLLAFQPDDKINDMIDEAGLPRYTERTITDKGALLKELKAIRLQDFAVSYGEHVDLLNTVSAPVRNHTGTVVASLGITWVAPNSTSDALKRLRELVTETACKITMELGY